MNKTMISALLAVLPLSAVAADADPLFQPHFLFKHQTITTGTPRLGDDFWQDESKARENLVIDRNNATSSRVNQFDATIAYPFSVRDRVNFDLGVNIRFIEGDFAALNLNQANYRITTALPMFYANALFDLPYDGLQASFGATHLEYDQYSALDYRAKLSYTWANGFGLEGGWQHQQFSIDNSDVQAQFENKGPFLDFKLRF